jgi:hypothetical protein
MAGFEVTLHGRIWVTPEEVSMAGQKSVVPADNLSLPFLADCRALKTIIAESLFTNNAD